jgi:hypothetical protein
LPSAITRRAAGEGYFFARADLEALQATLENAV